MPETLIEFAGREYDYLRRQEGRDFFLALTSYVNALIGKRTVKRVIRQIEREVRDSLDRYAKEQTEFIAEATRIRQELAERAPEIDNSDMQRPDVTSHERARYDLDSFARFDELRDADAEIGYPTLPSDQDDPGSIADFLVILRGRLRAAEYGEGASGNAPQIRDDLGDLARRISNLAQGHDHALRRYRQEARTLPGLAFARLAHFGSDLNPDPVVIKTDEDIEQWLDRALREWGNPKTIVRKFVNGERLERGEADEVAAVERTLKGELDRLHQELTRRLARRSPIQFVREDPLLATIVSTIIAGVVAGLILADVFGIGGGSTSPSGPSKSASLAAVTEVRGELERADAALQAAAENRFWGAALPLPTEEWNRKRDVLAAVLPRQDWQRVADFYALAKTANANRQNFTGRSGEISVRDLRAQLQPALRALDFYLR